MYPITNRQIAMRLAEALARVDHIASRFKAARGMQRRQKRKPN